MSWSFLESGHQGIRQNDTIYHDSCHNGFYYNSSLIGEVHFHLIRWNARMLNLPQKDQGSML
jgi:hypothetical protein